MIADLLGKRETLDTSTITRDRLDDHVAEEFEGKSERYRSAVEQAPEVDGEPVPHWDALARDVFKSYYTYGEPRTLDQNEVEPDYEGNRRIMQRFNGTDEHRLTRSMTRRREFESAFSTMSAMERLTELANTELKDLMREQQKAADAQHKLDEALLTEPQSENERDATEAAAENARQELDDARGRMESIGLSDEAVAQIEQAAAEGREAARVLSRLPGVGRGNDARVSADDALKLAERFNTPEMRRLAQMIGRVLPDMRGKRSKRTRHGREEIVDIGLGNDLENVLPSELAKLMDDDLEWDFLRRYAERSLLQYEKLGTSEVATGHIVICVDSSTSMRGAKHQWARSVVASLLAIARREKRDAAVIDYSDANHGTRAWEFKHRGRFDTEDFFSMIEHFFGGGTDVTPALRQAKDIIDSQPGYERADIVLISDGEDRWEADDEALRAELTSDGVRVHGVMIGRHPTDYLTRISDTTVPAYNLTGTNDATDTLATHV